MVSRFAHSSPSHRALHGASRRRRRIAYLVHRPREESLRSSRMGGAQMLMVFLVVFMIFTVTLGVGLQLYGDMISKMPTDSGAQGIAAQGGLMGILFLFAGGAVLFLISAARWAARRE